MKILEIKSTNNTDTMVFIDKITHITETAKGCCIYFSDTLRIDTTASFEDVKNAVYEQIARCERGKEMQPCNRKDICYHYPKHCELCQATSDMVNCYPCFQDKDIVGVVRCKDCIHRNTPDCKMWYQCVICGDYHHWERDEYFCSYGERKEE